jgi:Asp-tRNA(Asn)/Glu-tRNA(Gln) amidotransferase A subunit family amidase
MPVGMQLVGPVGGDERLLNSASWAEDQLGHR